MEFLILVLIGFAGIFLHIVAKFRDAITQEPKQGRKFMVRLVAVWLAFDLLSAISYGVFALIIVLILVLTRKFLNEVIGFPVNLYTIAFYGYFADSVFKNLKPENIK